MIPIKIYLFLRKGDACERDMDNPETLNSGKNYAGLKM